MKFSKLKNGGGKKIETMQLVYTKSAKAVTKQFGLSSSNQLSQLKNESLK